VLSKDMLLIEHKSKDTHLQDQFTLGEFQSGMNVPHLN